MPRPRKPHPDPIVEDLEAIRALDWSKPDEFATLKIVEHPAVLRLVRGHPDLPRRVAALRRALVTVTSRIERHEGKHPPPLKRSDAFAGRVLLRLPPTDQTMTIEALQNLVAATWRKRDPDGNLVPLSPGGFRKHLQEPLYERLASEFERYADYVLSRSDSNPPDLQTTPVPGAPPAAFATHVPRLTFAQSSRPALSVAASLDRATSLALGWRDRLANDDLSAALRAEVEDVLADTELMQAQLPAAHRVRAILADIRSELGDARPGVQASEFPYVSGVFCRVAAGPAVVGASPLQLHGEVPQQAITIDYDYYIAVYPVTIAQLAPYHHELGFAREAPPGLDMAGAEVRVRHTSRPATVISWRDAADFCRWQTHGTRMFLRLLSESQDLSPEPIPKNYVVRLPTEFEWEKAARGTSGEIYSWGKTIDDALGIIRRTAHDHPTAVGLYPDEGSPYGVQDLCGNVWEWCADPWSSDESPSTTSAALRVVKGGGGGPDPRLLRAAVRLGNVETLRLGDLGFRMVVAPRLLDD